MPLDLSAQQQAYADLIIRAGVNLQPGQALLVIAEIGQRGFARLLATTAYDAGARYVKVDWLDPLLSKARYLHADPQHLDYVPQYEVARRQEMLDDGWAYVYLTGSEYPDALEEVDPASIRREVAATSQKFQFWRQRVMNNEISWCIAGAPTPAWAQKVFPDLDGETATQRLWELLLRVCRADQPDPWQAWQEHDASLKRVSAFMDRHQIRTIRYLDETPGPDGKPASDLTVGLTERPYWSCGSSWNAAGRPFFANIPSEEIFTTPHKDRVDGWVRTCKPFFPFQRRVEEAYFRIENGHLVEWSAGVGQDVLDQLFDLPGARQLGEVSLVDVRSPINQSGLVFHDTLFDENAVCHVAFGRGYPEGVAGGNGFSREELDAMGVNWSDTHDDLMIGTATMRVSGTCADGSEVLIMEKGQFVDEVLA